MNKSYHTAILSLGSNIGDRKVLLQKAIYLLENELGPIDQISSIYETPAWGFNGENFYNCCVSLHTSNDPMAIMDSIVSIEQKLGRIRYEDNNYHSRTIDIDLLYLEDLILNTSRLILPHPHLHKRRFVLEPLEEIAPKFIHPLLKKDTKSLMEICSDDAQLTKINQKLYKEPQLNYGGLGHLVIEGNIGAGKTSLAHKLSTDFNSKLILEEFNDNPLLEKFYQNPKKYAYDLELSFLEDRYRQYHDHIHHHTSTDGLIISDYDLKKSLIFASITLDKKEYAAYTSLFELKHQQLKKPDLYLYLHQPIDKLLANIEKRGRSYEQSIQREYLEQLEAAYLNYFNTSSDNILLLDAAELDFLYSEEDYQYLIKILVDASLKA